MGANDAHVYQAPRYSVDHSSSIDGKLRRTGRVVGLAFASNWKSEKPHGERAREKALCSVPRVAFLSILTA